MFVAERLLLKAAEEAELGQKGFGAEINVSWIWTDDICLKQENKNRNV